MITQNQVAELYRVLEPRTTFDNMGQMKHIRIGDVLAALKKLQLKRLADNDFNPTGEEDYECYELIARWDHQELSKSLQEIEEWEYYTGLKEGIHGAFQLKRLTPKVKPLFQFLIDIFVTPNR